MGFVLTFHSAPNREVIRIKNEQQAEYDKQGKNPDSTKPPQKSISLYSDWDCDASRFPRNCIAIALSRNDKITVDSYEFGTAFEDNKLGMCLHAYRLPWGEARSALLGLPTKKRLKKNSKIIELAMKYRKSDRSGKLFVNGKDGYDEFVKLLTLV